MTSIWVQSIVGSLDESLDLLAAAVRDCTAELWETSMWEVPAVPELSDDTAFLDADWNRVTDPEQHRVLSERWVARYSTPWSVSWHALEVLDYDLSGGFTEWAPPAPFTDHPHWRDLATLPEPWSREAILGYIDHCRRRVRDTLDGITEERASTPLPPAHRYSGRSYAALITSLIGHTTEHASQIRQSITAAGIGAGA